MEKAVLTYSLHCDLSYDGTSNVKGKPHVPETYVFAGFFADDLTCESIERQWVSVNSIFGVSRFHAAHLNAKSNEYNGWDDEKKKAYSAELLKILSAQGKRVYAISCGMFADEYRRIISVEGQRKMGSPYIACFNSCIALVAQSMNAPGAFSRDDRFSVLLDLDDGCSYAVKSFYRMKTNSHFQHRDRLGDCDTSSMERTTCLQVADLIAYELFKSLHSLRKGIEKPRHPLKSLMRDNVVSERFFGSKTLRSMKAQIEETPSVHDGLVIVPEF